MGNGDTQSGKHGPRMGITHMEVHIIIHGIHLGIMGAVAAAILLPNGAMWGSMGNGDAQAGKHGPRGTKHEGGKR